MHAHSPRDRNFAPGRKVAVIARFAVAGLIASAGSLTALPLHAADDLTIHAFSTAAIGELPPGWKFATLPNKVATRYAIVDLGGVRVLKVEADESYGNLVHALHAKAGAHTALSWRWRVDKLIDSADITTRAGDDSVAKMCVMFGFKVSKLPFGERVGLQLATAAAGEAVPPETLCYVWDNKVAVGTGMANAFTKRIRYIVLQSGTQHLGQWLSEQRDVSVDHQRMFGDESAGEVPDIIGVAVSADADSTHGHGLSYFGDVKLTP